jgi:hypothetical protein
MSWSIPAQIEKDFLSGKAQYRTFQTGVGAQSILPVPSNAYVVIFGYDFSPAGGGILGAQALSNGGVNPNPSDGQLSAFGTQQLSFYTGTDFYPFIHHVDVQFAPDITGGNLFRYQVDTTPIARQIYIMSNNDVTITHGLVRVATAITTGTIPVTSRTPAGLTFGGSGLNIQAQTNFGPAATPLQFLQPSPKDFQDFGLGLVPNNADGQAFATPDNTNGLVPSQVYVASLLSPQTNNPNAHYYLCLHYALYTETVPESLG